MPQIIGCPQCWNNGKFGIGRWGVDEARIARDFGVGGQVNINFRLLAETHEILARERAPVRTGRLRRLHYRVITRTAMYGIRYYVGTKAGYARFLAGTAGKGSGRIYSKSGEGLTLRPVPYSWFAADDPRRYRFSVQGQPRHKKWDWLEKSAFDAFSLSGLLSPSAKAGWNAAIQAANKKA